MVELTDTTVDPAVWGRNFPQQYDDYRKTVDMVHTRYGGSEATPRTPTAIDPRAVVAQSRLQADPRLMEMWAGYAFAKDFREERGHAYMLDDQVFTERQQVGEAARRLPPLPRVDVRPLHARRRTATSSRASRSSTRCPTSRRRSWPATTRWRASTATTRARWQLRVTRPGFLEGIRALKASQGVADYDVNRDASRQEMRTYVCGQCHVEYYFKGKEKRLTYPWERGLKVDSILAYYEANGHKDWTHARSGAPVLKAQHPEFEMYNQGIHARSGVACADCHMPYERARRAQDQRPPRAEPAAQPRPGLPDLPQGLGGGAARAGLHHPGPHLRDAEHRDRRAAAT